MGYREVSVDIRWATAKGAHAREKGGALYINVFSACEVCVRRVEAGYLLSLYNDKRQRENGNERKENNTVKYIGNCSPIY